MYSLCMATTSYYTCIHETSTQQEHCVKGLWEIPGVRNISTLMPNLPFFIEKQIFEHRFPNHVLHPGLVVHSTAKPKGEGSLWA